MTIREYLDNINRDSKNINWNQVLEQGGYYPVNFTTRHAHEYYEIHNWCREMIGDKHYAWTGSKMWFENEEAALLFSMKWL